MAFEVNKIYLHFICVSSLYFIISYTVFNKVYETSQLVIDELFHIPQGLQYCKNNYTHWDPKITTLPGLYFASKIISLFFLDCSVYVLRFTNLIASTVNLHLLYCIIVKQNYPHSNASDLRVVFQAVNLAILPPLYFFSHVYYTDTLSLTFILMFIYSSLSKKYVFALVSGALSVFMRQTNIVWIGFYLARKLLDSLYRSYIKSLKGKDLYNKTKCTHVKEVSIRIYTTVDVFYTMLFHLKTCFIHFFKSTSLDVLIGLFCNSLVLVGFGVFVYVNGSIVVGDKTAHTATLNIPQMFYFTLFYFVFSLPLLISTARRDISSVINFKWLTALLVILCIAVVYLNTVVHPYLLADNRHYTFYVWSRFYRKYWFARYIVIPLYVYVFYSIMNAIRSLGAGFSLPYTVCLFASLALQKMLEIRYFLIPYIILRVSYEVSSWKVIISEFIIYLLINFLAFNIFFNKEIYWSDFKEPQRLMW